MNHGCVLCVSMCVDKRLRTAQHRIIHPCSAHAPRARIRCTQTEVDIRHYAILFT